MSSGNSILAVGCLLILSACLHASAGSLDEIHGKLLSHDMTERTWAFQELQKGFTEDREILRRALEVAVERHLENHDFRSPLHCIIEAVSLGRVFEAEDTLLTIVDYELTTCSFPEGMDVPGDYFYPAARALVQLRIGENKVINALARAKQTRQIRLLTWVLCQRAGSREEAQRVLEPSKSNENIAAGIELLAESEDLLPPPNSTTDRTKAE